MRSLAITLPLALAAALLTQPVAAQTTPRQRPGAPAKPPAPPAGITPPPGYVIGADDVLLVLYWREKEMSVETSVRPDGMITLPLLNEVQAAGLTPEQLRLAVEKAAAEFVEEPAVTIVIKQINSRRVFVTGNVMKAGVYPLTTAMTVLQAIAAAGGLNEYADEKGISVIRQEGRETKRHRFNYRDVRRGRKLEQNIELKPGDTIVVP